MLQKPRLVYMDGVEFCCIDECGHVLSRHTDKLSTSDLDHMKKCFDIFKTSSSSIEDCYTQLKSFYLGLSYDEVHVKEYSNEIMA